MALDEALRHASEQATASVAAIEPDRLPAATTSTLGRRVVVVAVALIAVGAAVVVGRPEPDRAAQVTASEPASAGPEAGRSQAARYVTDQIPDGLTSGYVGTVGALADGIGVHGRHVYGVAGRPPVDDDVRLFLTYERGVRPPSLPADGTTVAVAGAEGRLVDDDTTVVFESGPYFVAVYSVGLTGDELVSFASALAFGPEGRPLPMAGDQHGLRLLDVNERQYHDELHLHAPVDGAVTVYRQGEGRYLDMISTPAPEEGVTSLHWSTRTVEQRDLDGLEVLVLANHEDYGSPFRYVVWIDGEDMVEAISFGLTAEEMDAAVTSTRAATGPGDTGGRTAGAGPDDEVAASTERDLPETTATGGFVTLAPPDGLSEKLSADHADLGPPDWTTTEHLYATDSPDGPVLLIALTPGSGGLLVGEPIEVNGVDGVIVDKAAAGTSVDIELVYGDQLVSFRALGGLTTEEVLAFAEQYTRTAFSLDDANPDINLPFELTARSQRSRGYWAEVDLSGDLGESSVLYTNDENPDARLVIATVAGSADALESFGLRHPAAVDVQVGGAAALVVEPTPGVLLLQLMFGDELIELTSSGLSRGELLAAAAALQPMG